MPLSEEELRLLEQMERALVEEDPKLASTAGIGLLVGAVLMSQPVLGVIGFVVMLGGAVLAVTALRAPAALQGRSAPDVRQSGHGGSERIGSAQPGDSSQLAHARSAVRSGAPR